MTLLFQTAGVEENLIRLSSESLIQIAGGSPILLGAVLLIGLAVVMHKLQIGFAPSVAITTFVLGTMSMTFDSNTFGNVELPFSFFNLGFLLLIFGMGVILAITLFRQR